MTVGYKSKLNGAFDQPVDLDDVYVRKEYFDTGNLWMWGGASVNYGQLGDNTRTNKSSPVQTVAGGIDWKQVGCGYSHTSGIKADGTLWTWGRNNSGQLGDNSTVDKSSPVQTVAGGTNWKQVSCGNRHTAAVKTDGSLWMWGYNYFRQLGDNTTVDKSSPVQTVSAGANWKKVSAGGFSTAAIKTDGTLWTWGYNNQGQLGNNNTTNQLSPVQTVAGGTNWKDVAIASHTMAIKTDGTLWVWGYNLLGQLGDNTTSNKSSPIQTITGGTNWKEIPDNIGNHSAAIKTDGTLWTWGWNSNGQLGNNNTTNQSSPVQTITGGNNWKKVSAGARNTSAIKTDGTLWIWGSNQFGQLGNNNSSIASVSSPIQTIAGGTSWYQVSSGYHMGAIF